MMIKNANGYQLAAWANENLSKDDIYSRHIALYLYSKTKLIQTYLHGTLI